MISPPRIPWQVTGNHWLNIPCIHPADASIHSINVVHAGLKGAIDFAGSPDFINGSIEPLMRLAVSINGAPQIVGSEGIAWERESGWIPSFAARLGDVVLRGVICAPFGRGGDVPGFVVLLTCENRGVEELRVRAGLAGTLGHRQLRIRTARAFQDSHRVASDSAETVVLEGTEPQSPVAIALGCNAPALVNVEQNRWSISDEITLGARESVERAFLVAAGQERDGAQAVLNAMRRAGASELVAMTRRTLREMEPATGSATADRLIARHVFFSYFCAVARAIDDAHLCVMRSRIPWNGVGVTIRDWEALMWIHPAVQLIDKNLARDLLLRICDLHGYAPGAGVHYIDGSMFEPGFSLEGAAAFPIAVDEYIVQSGDDKIVEEPLIADSLYNAFDDINARRDEKYSLYSTEVNPDGSLPEFSYTAHGNAAAALALDVLKHTLDEKTAEKVEDAASVRAALLRHFGDGQVLVKSSDLRGGKSSAPAPSMYWLPYFDLLPREDSTYRRTVKPLEASDPPEVFARIARLLGPAGSAALEWLRRAPMDNGFACEVVDDAGRAIGNGGDAALSGLLAFTAWYAVNALGVKPQG
jgi:hypothetical protein